MKNKAIFFTVILFSLYICGVANAERGIQVVKKSDGNRTALIIGNSDYQNAPLRNPANDARDVAKVLRENGFEVTLKINASQRQMENAVRTFGKKLRQGGTGLFYYAGHGIQVSGRNYLIPTDAKIESEADVKYEAVDAGLVLGKMEDAANDLNIVILDACRNNPFARSFRSAEQGLARMDAPKGSLIAYATAPGSVAADGNGENGIFTKHLIKNIQIPGLTIEQILKRVRIAVFNETLSKQVPWESSSLMGNFYFHSGEATVVPNVPVPMTIANAETNTKNEFKIQSEATITADKLFDKNMWDESIMAYQQVISTTPNDRIRAYALYRQALAFVELGDSQTAKIILNKLISNYGKFKTAKQGAEVLKNL